MRGASTSKPTTLDGTGRVVRLAKWARDVLWDWEKVAHSLHPLLLLGELALCMLIVMRVAYTEIDWKAYMQEVQFVLDGVWDYPVIRANTGPLVYPAGFVYLYVALHWLTGADPLCCRLPLDGSAPDPSAISETDRCVSGGGNIRLAQWIYVGFYLATTVVVLQIYRTAAVTSERKAGRPTYPPWVGLLLCLSLRIHSIFMLRLFNDPVAMLLLYCSVLFFMRYRWVLGCVLFSAAVSIKMNIFLFAPGLFFVLLQAHGFMGAIGHIAVCAVVQLALGLPFMLENARGYIGKAFELSRVFTYKWTVNFKFLSEEAFVSKRLAGALLAGNLLVWLAVANFLWCRQAGGIIGALKTAFETGRKRPLLSPRYIAFAMFSSNYVGIVFARTLHYQFYSWYFHTIPFLAWHSVLPVPVKIACMIGIEYAFNVFPATAASSAVLQCSHAVLLLGLLVAAAPQRDRSPNRAELQANPEELRRLARLAGIVGPARLVDWDTECVHMRPEPESFCAALWELLRGPADAKRVELGKSIGEIQVSSTEGGVLRGTLMLESKTD